MFPLSDHDVRETGEPFSFEGGEEVVEEGNGFVGMESVAVESDLRPLLRCQHPLVPRQDGGRDDTETDPSCTIVSSHASIGRPIRRPCLSVVSREGIANDVVPLRDYTSSRVLPFDRDLSVPVLRLSRPLASSRSVPSLPALGSSRETLVAVRAELEEGGSVADVELGEGGAGREGREEGGRSEVDPR
jgi:hypothetical protein